MYALGPAVRSQILTLLFFSSKTDSDVDHHVRSPSPRKAQPNSVRALPLRTVKGWSADLCGLCLDSAGGRAWLCYGGHARFDITALGFVGRVAMGSYGVSEISFVLGREHRK